jgi:hypothetical protein
MTALPRSAATAVSTLPPAARGPRLSVACRNPVSTASLRGSCRMHVLLHAAVAAMMASAALSVAHAQRWSTAQLSQARWDPSATSVGTVAIFAGGWASRGFSNVVDLYDSGTGRWSTAQLSQARQSLSATSVGTVAMFAGGYNGKLLRIVFLFVVRGSVDCGCKMCYGNMGGCV